MTTLQNLPVFRAARLVGVSRSTLQKRIQQEDIETFEGEISIADLLRLYPGVNLSKDSEYERVQNIKETAFSRRLAEAVLPDAETLASRVSELGRALFETQSQLSQYKRRLEHVIEQLSGMQSAEAGKKDIRSLLSWIDNDLKTPEGEWNAGQELLAYNTVLGIISAHIKIRPSQREFWLEGRKSILEAAVQSGISLNYGCTSGNCGLCKARIVSGDVKKIRHHDYVLSEAEKNMDYVLLCSNTAVTDLVIEALEAHDENDIPHQEIPTRVKKAEQLNDHILQLHLQTPRVQRLRFLAGQSVMLTFPDGSQIDVPVASCPCDDRNLLFHLNFDASKQTGNSVPVHPVVGDEIRLTGPHGNFLLNEKTGRKQVYIAHGLGFAPIKSLIEHAMAIDENSSMHLYRIAHKKTDLYLDNLCRSWNDALDDFQYHAITGEDFATSLEDSGINFNDCDVYLAGTRTKVEPIKAWLLANGMSERQLNTHCL
jgi:CDP-4-dehydro-6-deoxyglucose reductase